VLADMAQPHWEPGRHKYSSRGNVASATRDNSQAEEKWTACASRWSNHTEAPWKL
jgi:hypothetical protein